MSHIKTSFFGGLARDVSLMQASRGVLNNMIFEKCIWHYNFFVDKPPCQSMSKEMLQYLLKLIILSRHVRDVNLCKCPGVY